MSTSEQAKVMPRRGPATNLRPAGSHPSKREQLLREAEDVSYNEDTYVPTSREEPHA